MEFEAKLIKHRNKSRIAVWYDNKPELIARFRKLDNARWSTTLQVWHLPDTAVNRNKFGLETDKGKGDLRMDKIEEIERFRTYLNTRRYSDNTVKTYSESLQSFFTYFNDREIKTIDNNDVVSFYNDYILEKKLSASFQNQVHPVG